VSSGFGDRIKSEVDNMPGSLDPITVIQDSQRKHASWIGGSMYATLATYDHLKITKQEYSESDNIIHHKYL